MSVVILEFVNQEDVSIAREATSAGVLQAIPLVQTENSVMVTTINVIADHYKSSKNWDRENSSFIGPKNFPPLIILHLKITTAYI